MGRNVKRLRRSGTVTPVASEIEIDATADRVWSPGSAISLLNSRDLPTCYFAGVAETQL